MKLIYILTSSVFMMSMSYHSNKVRSAEAHKHYMTSYKDTLKIKPSWKGNRIIIGDTNNPVGLIGVYNKTLPLGTEIADTKQAVEFLCFPQADSTNFLTITAKGFKLLNTNPHLYRDPRQFWNHFNRPWLESLVIKKATIYVLSDVKNDLLKYGFTKPCDSCIVNYNYREADYQLIRTGFCKELEFLDSLVLNGDYYWNEQTGAYHPKHGD